jgi:sulfur-oxidizing protein SoxZ
MAKKYKTRLKVKEKDGMVNVKAIISHPMLTGLTKDKKGEKIPAHYINEVVVTANDEVVMTANWGGAVSKDPYISFDYVGKSGDVVKLSWADNQENKGEAEKKVK